MHSILPRHMLLGCALLLVPLTVACERPAEDDDDVAPAETVPAPPPGVTAARDQFEAAWNGDDPAAVTALLAEDATATPGDSTYRGRAEIERGWIRPVLPARSDVQLTSTSTQQVGDDWRDEGMYSVTVHAPEGETRPEEGRYSIVWTRGPGGDWHIRSIDVQADQAPQN